MNDSLPSPERAASDRSSPIDSGEMAMVVLESLAEAVYVLDRDWRIVFANAAFARHMRMSLPELLGQTLWDVLPPAQHTLVQTHLDRMMRTGVAETFVQQSVVQPGVTIDARAFPVSDGLAVVFRDITRRIAAVQALAVSEAHLRLALDGAAMGDWAWDARTDAMTFSERTMMLYGLGPEAQGLPRDKLRDLLIHPEDAPAVRAATETAQVDQKRYDVSYRVRRGEGWRWIRAMGGPHVIDGQIVGVHGLVQDIDDRKRAEDQLRAEIEEREKAQQRQDLLIHELNHRVKNILAMVQAMAAQTLSTAPTPKTARAALDSRLMALAQAHDVLTRESWDGAELMDIVNGAVAAHERPQAVRFRIEGPHLRLRPQTAVSLALALHELATNAVKYGALSNDAGWVTITWTATPHLTGTHLALSWVEQGGPIVEPPQRQGFGTRLIGRSLGSEDGTAELGYPPEGARCDISVVLPRL